MNLKELQKAYPHIFQFQAKELEFEEILNEKPLKAEFFKLNSIRRTSNPFYKPISKIIQLKKSFNENL